MYYKHYMLWQKLYTAKQNSWLWNSGYLAYITKLSAKTTDRFFINKVYKLKTTQGQFFKKKNNSPNFDPPLSSGSKTMDNDWTSSTETCEQLISWKLKHLFISYMSWVTNDKLKLCVKLTDEKKKAAWQINNLR